MLVVGAGQEDHGLEDPPVGNGRAMSVLFGRERASVAVADLNAESADATAELVRAEGATAEVIAADAADEEAAAAMFESATASLGGLDGVVMNLGIGAGLGIARDQRRRVGPRHGGQPPLALPRLQARPGGDGRRRRSDRPASAQ